MALHRIISSALYKAYKLWTTPVLRFRIEYFPQGTPRYDVDERISRIDDARHNLKEALDAIDDLKVAAEKNKAAFVEAMQALSITKAEKSSAENELLEVQKIAESDVLAFKKLAGVPTRRQIAIERFIGFFIGVLASLLASGIWWIFSRS